VTVTDGLLHVLVDRELLPQLHLQVGVAAEHPNVAGGAAPFMLDSPFGVEADAP
jgi:hypothetical protein